MSSSVGLPISVTIPVVVVSLILFLLLILVPSKWSISRLLSPSTDHFLTVRKSQTWVRLGLSLYAAAAGTWALTAPVENAITSGWWGALGYTIACGMAWLPFIASGLRLRRFYGCRGFTSLDFVQERYGRVVNCIVTLNALVYLLLMMVTELTAIGSAVNAVSPGTKPIGVIIAVTLVTALFSALGGMPASFLGDGVAAILTIILVSVAYGAVFGNISSRLIPGAWTAANSWDSSGIPVGLTLIFACFVVEQANQATWQRVLAARTDKDVVKGFVLGVCLMTPSMLLFSMAGFVGLAASKSGIIEIGEGEEYSAMFLMLGTLPKGLLVVVLVLCICLVTSTVSTIQTGLAAVVAGELSFNTIDLRYARLITLALNVPVVIIAGLNPPSIFTVMMIGNTFSVCIVPITLCGFSSHATPLGAIVGICSGLVTVLVYGWARTKTFVGGFKWFTFPDGYDWHCFATFVISAAVCIISLFATAQIQFAFNKDLHNQQKYILAEIQSREELAGFERQQQQEGQQKEQKLQQQQLFPLAEIRDQSQQQQQE